MDYSYKDSEKNCQRGGTLIIGDKHKSKLPDCKSNSVIIFGDDNEVKGGAKGKGGCNLDGVAIRGDRNSIVACPKTQSMIDSWQEMKYSSQSQMAMNAHAFDFNR